MKNLAALLLIVSFNASAACTYSIAPNTTKVSWKAFKTPKKVGVDGEFKKFTIKPAKESAASVDELLKDAKFDIDSSSVSTGNPDRDKKIVKNFFQSEGKAIAITGTVSKVSAAEVTSKLTLGKDSKDINFVKTKVEKKVRLESSINVLEFNLKTNLEKLTAACKALHEGVTWPDVTVAIEFDVQESCK